jgi:ABC-type glucose/galactose transport system permease subunit
MNALLYVGIVLLIVSNVLIPPSLLRFRNGTSRLLSSTVILPLAGSATMLVCALTSTDASVGQRWATALAGVLCGSVLAATIALLIRPRSAESH